MILGDGNWSDFETLIKWFGLPGALFFAMIIAFVRGWIISGREASDLRTSCEKMKTDYEHRLENLREEKNYWRDIAVQFTGIASSATNSLETAVRKLPRAIGSPPEGE